MEAPRPHRDAVWSGLQRAAVMAQVFVERLAPGLGPESRDGRSVSSRTAAIYGASIVVLSYQASPESMVLGRFSPLVAAIAAFNVL